MASPVDAARATTNITTAADPWSVTLPGSIAAGNLLVVFSRCAASGVAPDFNPHGFTELVSDSSDASDDGNKILYKWATGSETSPISVDIVGGTAKGAVIVWRITGAENPATTAPSVSNVVIGTAANINPAPVPAGDIDIRGATGVLAHIVGGSGSQMAYAQSLTTVGTQISQVSLVFGLKTGTGGTDYTVELQSDSSGQPSGTVVGTIGTVTSSTVTVGASVDLPCSISVSNATTYWIVIRRATADTSNYLSWNSQSAFYSGGQLLVQNSGTWGSGGTDAAFAIFTTAPTSKDYLFLTVVGLDSETATFTSPSGYSTATTANSGTGGAVATNCMIAGASKQATAAGEDPGAWTSSAPATGVSAWTIAIPPTAAATPGPGVLLPQYRRRADRFLVMR